MTPLRHLGLDETADARAVKAAYARRLKTTRPDEDPRGFQALNEAYGAALAEVAWRARQAEDGAASIAPYDPSPSHTMETPPDLAAPDLSPPAPASPDSTPLVFDADNRLPQGTDISLDEREAAPNDDDDTFTLELGLFLPSLFAQASEHDPIAFRAWLTNEIEPWPIAVEPLVAPHIVPALLAEAPVMDVENLETIVEFFALEDVLTAVDPFALKQVRETTARTWAYRQRGEEVRRLLRVENRDALVDRMRSKAAFPYQTRWIVALLTTANAVRWSLVLRWFPFTSSMIMRFIRELCGDRIDAMTPPVDNMVIEIWSRSDRAWTNFRPLSLSILVIGILGTVGFTSKTARTFVTDVALDLAQVDRDDVALTRINAIYAVLESDPTDAAIWYKQFIIDYPGPWSSSLARYVALAHYNRGVALSKLTKTAEAAYAFEEVDRIFATSEDDFVKVQVAKALVNLAVIRKQAGDQGKALELYTLVFDRYVVTSEGEMDVLVAKALAGRITGLTATGRRSEALVAYDDLIKRFGSRSEPSMLKQLEYAKQGLRKETEVEPLNTP